jgi:hypothetical protein
LQSSTECGLDPTWEEVNEPIFQLIFRFFFFSLNQDKYVGPEMESTELHKVVLGVLPTCNDHMFLQDSVYICTGLVPLEDLGFKARPLFLLHLLSLSRGAQRWLHWNH